MIFIGTMNLTRTRDRGNFYCPTCAVPQSYRLRARRPFLTIYFIPTVPIGGAEEFVQCDQCRSSWDVSVLTMDADDHANAIAQRFHDEAMRACILIAQADGVISEDEIGALQRISEQMFDSPLDREELGRLSSVARENGIEPTNYVLTVSSHWNQRQKLEAVGAMFLAASAGGDLGDQQLKLLANMRDILDLTNDEYESAIEQSLQYG